MPGFYPDGEYDLAGFIVGAVEREKIITGKDVQVGDVLIGLPSTGLHTNGYSLARKLFFEVAGYTPDTYVNAIEGKAGAELMKTHRATGRHPQADRRRGRGAHGAHHRRRHHGKPAARAAQRHVRARRAGHLAGAADLRAPAKSATWRRTR